jgi:hypothetical protein
MPPKGSATVTNLNQQTPQGKVNALSLLSTVDYELIREEEAKNLNFRTSVLDKAVSEARQANAQQTNDDVVISDEPYHSEVDVITLLSEIEALLTNHMILPNGAKAAVLLWIVASYVYDAFRIFPKLGVISPEKRCGKTTLLDILACFSPRSLLSSNITPSAIFRSVDLWQPTLIIDEADTFLSGRNDDLIGIINSGHTKTTAFVVRTVGDDHTPKKFSTWSPMAFASIKGLAGTVMDRSIIVHLRRRTRSEKVQRLPVDFREENILIRKKLVRWSQDNFNSLKANLIEPPEIPNHRAIDNWLPLFTVAHAIGEKWPERLKKSYCLLNDKPEDETAAIMLLQDIHSIFRDNGFIQISSRDLVDSLITIEERPWSEWKKGLPMTQNSLAKILKTFDIRSKDINVGRTLRGYEKKQFKDSFIRYLPEIPI